MDIRKELYKKNEEEWGYKIIVDNAVMIDQDFEPFVGGLKPMTERKANKCADEFIKMYMKQYLSTEVKKPKSLLSKIWGIFRRNNGTHV
jgi:hypothetical protein